MNAQERRAGIVRERRIVPRGGRRTYDLPGAYPPVLIAEAYEEARRPCATFLQNLHFEVAEASKPAEVIAMLDSGWVPHVILADAQAAEAVSQRSTVSRHLTTPPMIVMAGSFEASGLPKRDVLLKPFRLRTMVQAVRRALRRAAHARSTAPFGSR